LLVRLNAHIWSPGLATAPALLRVGRGPSTGRGHPDRAELLGSDEQINCAPVPCDRCSSSGHALPDGRRIIAHRGGLADGHLSVAPSKPIVRLRVVRAMLPGVERCGECGFAYDLTAAPWAAGEIRAGAADLAAIVADGTADMAARREPGRWSPLEYACHVRDMLLVQRERLLAARRLDRPVAEPMGRDERAELDGYAGQDPADVARQLGDAALLLAGDLARLGDPDWDRTLIYTYPERAERSLRWLAVHTVHEVRHHLADVRRQLPARAALTPGERETPTRCRYVTSRFPDGVTWGPAPAAIPAAASWREYGAQLSAPTIDQRTCRAA